MFVFAGKRDLATCLHVFDVDLHVQCTMYNVIMYTIFVYLSSLSSSDERNSKNAIICLEIQYSLVFFIDNTQYYYRVRQSSRPLKKMFSHLHHYTALFSRLDPPAHNHHSIVLLIKLTYTALGQAVNGMPSCIALKSRKEIVHYYHVRSPASTHTVLLLDCA